MKTLQPCIESGCYELVKTGRCLTHERAHNRATHRRQERLHPEWRAKTYRWVYSDPRWRRLRAQVRREQPTCARMGCDKRWTDLDHVVALQDGGAPFDRDNVMGLCHAHHSAKTADEVNERGKMSGGSRPSEPPPPLAAPTDSAHVARNAERKRRAMSMIAGGSSEAQVCAAVGVTPATASRWMAEAARAARRDGQAG
jgi:hypothetical protein